MELLEPVIKAMGYELIGCEYNARGRVALLRLYIESTDGITLEDCSRVSKQVGAVLEVENSIYGRYDLEVSSPGVNRPLLSLEHFKQFVGHKVKVRLYDPIDNRRNLVGDIIAVQNEKILLNLDGDEKIELLFNEIAKAKLLVNKGIN